MMTAVYIWMGLSAFSTFGIVSSMALGARRHIPAITSETVSGESMVILNHGVANGKARLSGSYAQ